MNKKLSVQRLREQAVKHTLFEAATIGDALKRLCFIQADPIKAPSTAQDLILWQRVAGYRALDLEKNYGSLEAEEDYLYAYGFLQRDISRLLHPRQLNQLSQLEKDVLKKVRRLGRVHPRDLEEHFGKERVVNAWGGYSKSTKQALEQLHYQGLLRVCGREKGIRTYEYAAPQKGANSSSEERSRVLALTVADILSPVSKQSLLETLRRVWRLSADLQDVKAVLDALLQSGELACQSLDGVDYVWTMASDSKPVADTTCSVRLLTPFDPLVWDRRRFEHLWGWQYRFEAYTPPAKRLRGYYAMPLLWNTQVIGWANVQVQNGSLDVETGFVESRPRDKQFRLALADEVDRFKAFLFG